MSEPQWPALVQVKMAHLRQQQLKMLGLREERARMERANAECNNAFSSAAMREMEIAIEIQQEEVNAAEAELTAAKEFKQL